MDAVPCGVFDVELCCKVAKVIVLFNENPCPGESSDVSAVFPFKHFSKLKIVGLVDIVGRETWLALMLDHC